MRSPERFTFAPLQFTAGSWDDAPAGAPTAPVDVRVLTWNVWFGGHMFDQRRDALLAELARRAPDVIALQEVTSELLDTVLETPWVRAHYQLSGRAITGYDVAILSRLPVRRFTELSLPTSMGRRLLVAELACGLAVATVHLESMRDEAWVRAAQLAVIQPLLVSHHPDALLVGDLNFRPGDPLETAVLDPSFVDVWPMLHPDDPGYTIDTDRNTMRLDVNSTPSRKRYDRIFARTARWRPRTIELVGTSAIDAAGNFTSDHFGLAATFTVA